MEVLAEVLIKTFNNRKGVGIVTHYDQATQKGVFLGLYDTGNTDGMTLSTFDGTTGKLTGTIAGANLFLGTKIQENVWYSLDVDVCYDAGLDKMVAEASVENIAGNPALSEEFEIVADWPDGIPHSGQIGIAGWAKSSFVNSSVRNFHWGPFDE